MGVAPAHTPSCPVCGGTGWKMLAPAAEHLAGRAVVCDCRRAVRGDRLMEQAGIPPRYRHCTLDDFEIYPQASDSLEEALMRARHFVDRFGEDTSGLLFLGPCGSGKTHLAVGIIKKLMETRAVECRFADHRELLKRIQATYDPQNPESEASVVEPLIQADVLLLDDLGVGRATEWALETLHYLLNHRYSHERITILTTNLEDAEAKRLRTADGGEIEMRKTLAAAIGERLRSRIYEMCRAVSLQGEDYRRRHWTG